MRSARKTVGYIVYLVVLAVAVTEGHRLLEWLDAQISRTYSSMPYVLWIPVVYFALGLLGGSDSVLRQFARKGEWRIDIHKLLIVGIPCAVLVVCSLLLWTSIQVTLPQIVFTVLSNRYVPAAAEVLLGYTIITSFYKDEEAIAA